uniref:Uncharacterized protein n=1 Tax=viral metagenome TaxID=1070528 RepID=A0A6M3LQW6_9ZZZZ
MGNKLQKEEQNLFDKLITYTNYENRDEFKEILSEYVEIQLELEGLSIN